MPKSTCPVTRVYWYLQGLLNLACEGVPDDTSKAQEKSKKCRLGKSEQLLNFDENFEHCAAYVQFMFLNGVGAY